MHDIGKLGLQVFAAPEGMTGQAQIQVRAREIDFVTSFGKNIQDLLDVLGITRMIRKANGTVLKTKTVKGSLKSGDVGEGEEIPLSQYTVEKHRSIQSKLKNTEKLYLSKRLRRKGMMLRCSLRTMSLNQISRIKSKKSCMLS